MKLSCRLCKNSTSLVYKDKRLFFACATCGLIFTDCMISERESRLHYTNQYDNGFDWLGESKYFIGIFPTDRERLKILDYGSGGGFLAKEIRTAGFDIESYEPMFDDKFNKSIHYNAYDFIILNEVVEHVDNIIELLENINDSLKHNGFVLIKTQRTDDIINNPHSFQDAFKAWWYKDDPTHISFFSTLTFEYICKFLFTDLVIAGKDRYSVVLYKR